MSSFLSSWRLRLAVCFVAAATGLLSVGAVRGEPIEIASIKHDGPVDFEKEVLPVLRRKCLACHNSTDAESDLVLETPARIQEGGASGPVVVPGKGMESVLLQVAAMIEEPVMPPEDNDVGAKPLTPQELGLLKLWIDQGAKGEVKGVADIEWMPLPPGVNPIYAVAISPDGQYAAAGRANQIFVYHVPSKREIGRLSDASLMELGIYDKPGAALLDLVQSLAFSASGDRVAAGGFQTVKIWNRPANVRISELAGADSPIRSLAVSDNGKWAAIGEENGAIQLFDLAAQKLSRKLSGHQAAVSSLTFSGDSNLLVSGSQDKSLRVWSVADGETAVEIVTPSEVNAVAMLEEGPRLLTAGVDKVIRVWEFPAATKEAAAEAPDAADAADAKEGEEGEGGEAEEAAAPTPIAELTGHSQAVTSLATLKTNQVLSGSLDGTARIWDVNGKKMIRQLNHGGPVTSVATTADGVRLATASNNKSAKLWDANGKQIAELKGDFRAKITVNDLTRAVSLAKRQIDAAKKDKDEAEKRKKAEEENQKKSEEALKKAQDDRKAKEEAAKKPVEAKAAADKKLEESKTQQTTAEEAFKKAEAAAKAKDEAVKAAKAAQTKAAEAAKQADAAAKQAADALKKAQDAAAAKPEEQSLKDAVVAAQKKADEATANATKAAEAKTAADKKATDEDAAKKTADANRTKADQELKKVQAAVKQAEAAVKKADAPAKKATDELNAAERTLKAAERSVERAKESVKKAADQIPVQDAAVAAAEAHHVEQTKALEGAKAVVPQRESPLHAVAFSPDGKTLATSGEDGVVRTWDAETGVAIESFTGHAGLVSALAYAPSGRLMSAGDDKLTVLWDTNPVWQLERTIGGAGKPDLVDRVTSLAFSRDGSLLATGSGEPSRSGQLKIWKVDDGSLVREIEEPHSDTIFGIEFSPDDSQVATCGADRFVKVFNVSDGKFVRSFEGHTHHVLGVSWQADGRVLASAGADNVIKVWDVRTGDQKRTISGFSKEVTAIRFVADSTNVVASCGDKRVHMKRVDNGGNVRTFSGPSDFVYSVGVSGDGKLIIAGGQDSVLRVWSDNGQVHSTFEPPAPQPTPEK